MTDRIPNDMTRDPAAKDLQDLIYLVSCAVNRTVPDAGRIRDMDLAALLAAASAHRIAAAAAAALASAGVRDAGFEKALNSSILRNAQMDMDMDALSVELEAAGIWYMPLKGAVLQELYPVYGMRETADRDILFDARRAGDVKAIMEKLGFRTRSFGEDNHDCYIREPVSSFEMHRELFDPELNEGFSAYYRDIGDRLEGSGWRKRFTPEDFYVFLTAHEYKHFAHAGTGLRSLLDTYVYLNAVTPDMDRVSAETEALGISDFEAANRSLALHLFGDGVLTEADRELLDEFLRHGAYGTRTHMYENRVRKDGGNMIRYICGRLAMPVRSGDRFYAMYSREYPLFYRRKILLPFLPFFRFFRALKNGHFAAELKAIRNVKGRQK